MNNIELLKKAADLADGWSYQQEDHGCISLTYGGWTNMHPQIAKDSLAAQLVRQMDTTGFRIEIDLGHTWIWPPEDATAGGMDYESGSDRTMNTIKAIVDSGVLE